MNKVEYPEGATNKGGEEEEDWKGGDNRHTKREQESAKP